MRRSNDGGSLLEVYASSALKTPTLDELYKRLRDLDFTQVDEILAVMLNTSGSQTGMGTSRLRELQERLQSRARENSARAKRPPTWRDHPVRSVIIASYKKNTDGAYHKRNGMD